MKVIFFDQSFFKPEEVRSAISENRIKAEILFPATSDELLTNIYLDKPQVLFMTGSALKKAGSDFIYEIRKRQARIYIVLVLEFDATVDASSVLTQKVDDYYYCKDSLRYIYLLKNQANYQLEKEERNLLLTQLEDSFRELQFQKFALDQAAIVSISNAKGEISYVNEQFCKLTGYRPDEVIGQKHKMLSSRYHSQEMWNQFYATINSGKVWHGEIKNLKKDGSDFWVDLTVVPFVDASGVPYKYVAIQFDITYRILAEQQLTHDAFYDPLTGLPNRAMFLAKIEEGIGRVHLLHPLKLYVVILNIKEFKRVNNTYGYIYGDRVLVELAQILTELDRDIVHDVSRLGSDSFGLLLTGMDLTEERLHRYFFNLQQILEVSLKVSGEEIFLNVSSGISEYGEGGRDGEELVRNAEIAMFKSKSGYSKHMVFFKKEMLEDIQNRMTIHKEMKRAVKEDQFFAYFQPIVQADNLELKGFEALVRWVHPSKGLIPPGMFLQEAEASGLILPISDIVYRKSIQFYQSIIEEFPTLSPLYISVNLTSKQFESAILDYFENLCNEFSITPELFYLEITESLAMEDTKKTLALLHVLRDRNFRISMDDFGTGYSSLSYLKEFPITTLKIDKSFIDNITFDSKDFSLLKTIVKLGKSMDLELVAEGVETPEQLKILQDLQCDKIQGYYFAKPMSVIDARQFIDENYNSIEKKVIVKRS